MLPPSLAHFTNTLHFITLTFLALKSKGENRLMNTLAFAQKAQGSLGSDVDKQLVIDPNSRRAEIHNKLSLVRMDSNDNIYNECPSPPLISLQELLTTTLVTKLQSTHLPDLIQTTILTLLRYAKSYCRVLGLKRMQRFENGKNAKQRKDIILFQFLHTRHFQVVTHYLLLHMSHSLEFWERKVRFCNVGSDVNRFNTRQKTEYLASQQVTPI